MNLRRAVKPILGLAAFAAIGMLGYVAFRYARPALSPYLAPFSTSDLEDAISGQRIAGLSLSGRIVPPGREMREEGTLAIAADLTVEVLQSPESELVFLLNPGLALTAASLNGEPVRWTRDGPVLTIQSNSPLAVGMPIAAHIEYHGTPTDGAYLPAAIRTDRAILPHLSFWHPLDLNGFFPIECTMEIPEDWVPALHDAKESSEGSRKRVAWAEDRPVLGATFIAGPYQRAARTHGAVRCDLFWEADGPTLPSSILDDLGAAYSYLRVLYGSDGFDQVGVVVDPNIANPFNGGNSVVGLPVRLPDAPRARFALLARDVAYNWWGNTVTGPWLAHDPEAASWIVHGFAEYSAWLTLRAVNGKAEELRYLESLRCPPSIDFPMKSISLRHAYESPVPSTPSDRAYIYVRQPFTVSVFAAQAGEDRFLEGCRNILRIHRFRPVSYLAVLQELELASETDLRETFRVWFERAGTFDYAIENVTPEPGSIRVDVSNPGDIPVFGELQAAIVSKGGLTIRSIEPGASGGSFLIPAGSPVETVILDPHYHYPDMRREDNTWTAK